MEFKEIRGGEEDTKEQKKTRKCERGHGAKRGKNEATGRIIRCRKED